MYLYVLGRQPEIGRAELARLASPVEAWGNLALADQELDINRLGGTQKVAKVLATLPSTDWGVICDYLRSNLADWTADVEQLELGLSAYGLKIQANSIFRLGLALKKELRNNYRRFRLVPNKEAALSTAQVLHHHLHQTGVEMIVAASGTKTLIARTSQVQDINRYSMRDFGRPCRPAKVGMLPPKLAQIMINLTNPPAQSLILDPFCGSGVVLQEALLMGYRAAGTDIDPEMVSCSQNNLVWLDEHFQTGRDFQLDTADATNDHLPLAQAVVTEGYLGPALEKAPPRPELERLQDKARDLTLEFMRNLSGQVASGTPICLTLPAWRLESGFARLGIIDQIEALGYNSERFTESDQSLVYWRKDQIVARELLVFRRK